MMNINNKMRIARQMGWGFIMNINDKISIAKHMCLGFIMVFVLQISSLQGQDLQLETPAADAQNSVSQRQKTDTSNPSREDGSRIKTGSSTVTIKELEGKWRGEFSWREGIRIPFNFEIVDAKGKRKIFFINGDERFDAGTVILKKDSVLVPLEQFDQTIAVKITGNNMTGNLRRADSLLVPIAATRGIADRFPDPAAEPLMDISGTYEITFKPADGPIEQAVALFTQNGTQIKASFLRTTGDSRYLQGVVNGNTFQLSSFIGSGPAYYRGTINADSTMSGEIVGFKTSLPFTGKINPEATLADPYKMTYLKNGYNSFEFSFPDLNGKMVSLKDERFKNKAVIVTISGTWCPNCMDEANFLVPWFAENKKRGVEIVALYFENKTDPDYVKKALTRFRDRFGINYLQLFGGKSDNQAVAAALPSLNTFLSFPTTIFIDKTGKVTKIHTGFSGPATGKFYEEFVRDFNQEIDRILGDLTKRSLPSTPVSGTKSRGHRH